MSDLTEWLLACIAEDEAVARDALAESNLAAVFESPIIHHESATVAEHVVRHQPSRVLAVCKAHRAIVEHQRALAEAWETLGDALDRTDDGGGTDDEDEEDDTPLPLVLRALATIYADRPGWREEWAS